MGKNNSNLNQRLIALALAGSLMLPLAWCSRYGKDKITLVQSVQSDSYNLFADLNYKIIKVKDAYGKEQFYFVKKIYLYEAAESYNHWPFGDTEFKYADGDKYAKYLNLGLDNTSIYMDLTSGNIVSIETSSTSRHLFKDNKTTTSYIIGTVTDEDTAYNYAVATYGNRDSYTMDEIIFIVNTLNNGEVKKHGTEERLPDCYFEVPNGVFNYADMQNDIWDYN